MKRAVLILLSLAVFLSIAACSGKTAEKQGDSMSLEEIFDSIQTGVSGLPALTNAELNADNYHYYLFIDPVEGGQALSNDAAINAVPHSEVLLRVPDSADAEAIAKQIEENADLRKWVCVGADKKIVRVHGNTIFLVMSTEETADALAANFDKLWS